MSNKKTEIIAVRLDSRWRCWLEYMASAEGSNISEVIRAALQSHKEAQNG